MRIRSYLLVFALAILLPIVAVSTIALLAYDRQQRAAAERSGVERARALADSVDRELFGAVTSLNVLATARSLERGDLAGFAEDARRVLVRQRGWLRVALTDPTGERLVEVAVSRDTRLPPLGEGAGLASIARTGQPEIGPLHPDPVSGRLLFTASVPVAPEGAVRYVLSAAIEPALIRDTLDRHQIPRTWIGTVFDPRRTIVARTHSASQFVGHAVSPEFQRLLDRAPAGWAITHTLEGAPVYTAFSRSSATGWGAGLGIPTSAVDAPLRQSLWAIAGGGALLLAVSIAMSALVGRRIAGPVATLAAAATAFWRRDVAAMPRVDRGPTEIREVARAVAEAARRQREADDQRAALLAASEAARAASEAGQQAAARLAAIVEGADDAIISKTLEGIVTSWNPAAERMYGWTAAEAIGQTIGRIIPADRMDEERDILERLQRGLRIEHFETERVARDGRRIPVSLTVSPLRAPSGEIVGASKIARDISEQKRIEAERAAILVRERAARAEAESASRARDEFLAMLGHELRNPLNVIVTAVEVQHLAGHDEAIAARARDAIQRQVRHLTGLVDDLLDVARVTAGKITLSVQPVDLGALATRSIQGLRESGRLGRHVVRERVDSVWVHGDEMRLDQVVANLLVNAIKFTPPDGEITVSVRADGDQARLCVGDTGVGMSPEDLPRIFDAFVQSEQSLDRSRGGLGLGLTLVRRLVELHGGTVEASSDGVGRGAVFTVRLPRIATPTPNAPAPADRGAAPPVSTQRVLLIEDEPDSREMLRMMLQLQGYEVHEAADGPSGVERALQLRPDTAIIDIELPLMDGYDVARRIRASTGVGGPRLVALTGHGREPDRQRAVAAGFDAHLVKPVDPERLARALTTALPGR
jgi:PAS domain S-box-containing protein